ncbi:MAG: beta-aspartyl-peptidase [Steroidobacteraceae bacterium]
MLLIRNADLHAPARLGPRDLLVGGGRILWIGAPRELEELPAALRAGCERIDLGGLRLIPGLVDAHVHVTGGGGEAGFRTRVPAPPLGRYTSAGVTTVVGLLGTDDTARGPRELLAGVYALREEGLAAWAWVGGYHVPPATVTGTVRGDLAMIEACIGVGEVAISDHRSSQPTFDEIARLGADAHVAGLMTGKAGIVHLHVGDGPRGLDLVRRALAGTEIPARTWHPTHVNRRRALFEEALDLARRGCTIDVTAFPVEEGEDAWSAADAVRRFLETGAPADRITVSSDAGGCLPCFDADGRVTHMDVGDAGALLATLADLESSGVPLERALPAFTSNPARLLRLPGKGVVEVGADADLVALDARGRAHTVVARGVVHLRAGVPERRGTFET